MKSTIKTIIAATALILGVGSTPATATVPDRDLHCMASIIYHEAGNQSLKGKQAVGYVVMNRVKSPRFPKTICAVILQKGQFTNFSLPRSHPRLEHFRQIARDVIVNYHPSRDPTFGAHFFHSGPNPGWRYKYTTTIGGHRFYKL